MSRKEEICFLKYFAKEKFTNLCFVDTRHTTPKNKKKIHKAVQNRKLIKINNIKYKRKKEHRPNIHQSNRQKSSEIK